MNRIPALNSSNRSHTSQDTCLIFKGAAVMQSWICEAGSRTDLIEHLGTDLEWALVPLFFFFPAQAHSVKLNPRSWQRSEKRGVGDGRVSGTKALMTCTKMYGQPICLLCFHSLQPTCWKGVFIWRTTSLWNQHSQMCLEPADIYQFSIIMISLSINFPRVSVKTTVLCSVFALWPAAVLLHKFYRKPSLREHNNAFVRDLFCEDLKTDQCFSHDCHGQMASLGAI